MANDHFLAMIAKMYYIDKVKQNEIARRLNIIPMAVSRHLKEAEQKGIVVHHVKMPWPLDNDLGNKVREKFKLRECYALEIAENSDIPNQLGSFLADYFVQVLPENAIVGLSWGYTISKFVQSLPYIQAKNCSLIQLKGSFTSKDASVTPTQIINEVSKKLNSRIYVLNAPLYTLTEDLRDQLTNDPTNLEIHQMAERSDINIIGLSSLARDATTFRSEVIGLDDYEELERVGAAGDLAGTFLDVKGNPVVWSKSRMYAGVPLEKISEGKNVICVAGERHKAPLLRQVCKKGYFDTLVTTQQTAQALLNE